MAQPYSSPAAVPPGLEYLSQIDQILVHQKIELLEAIIGFETNNQYEIKNSLGQKIFNAKENTDCCTRNICGPLRSFDLQITDNFDQEVIHLIRPYRCTSCCFPCCLQEMEVQSPPGNTIGYVKQDWHVFRPMFSIYDMSKTKVLSIEGPVCAVSCCGDVDFDVTGKDGHPVGRISKQWTGLIKESLTDTDNFGINFPMDLDVRMKAVLLGACFLIDFMFFEATGDSGQRCSVFG
ncbi:phospholipid scramblase 1 [Pimephales promelas]|uniref:phospholipid scramblase 1 n=1 Tax=Pimephales promelas TaxID=90988 RepID=UPI00195582EB|nr:phospholipid scramblase 1 [Pimephales promelas]XP_039515947.1 phospholipid scramblase 1 [Pimephales promelas]